MLASSGADDPDLVWANDECRRLVADQRAAGDLATARRVMDDFFDRWEPVDGVGRGEAVEVAGVACHRFSMTERAATGRVLYVHGGGFTSGSGASCHAMLGRMVAAGGFEVWACDYRLAPEHRFPSALDDVDAVLGHLLDAGDPIPVAIAGDSAGGGLATAAVLRRMRGQLDGPRGVALFSPLLDLTATAPSFAANESSDVMASAASVQLMSRVYARGNATDAEVSPLLAESFAGFPPTSLYVSADEVLRDDTLRLAERLRLVDVPVRVHLESGAPHAWPIFGDSLPQARATLEDAASFLAGQMASHAH
ncbi:alpha/beta hydrolase [Gordonia alkanivorans]|uniref:alpha/beta hydrolase n=1 Tax=Gordonia alkanivorans TaxID=84096 RepID=UPI00244B0FB7|nr:alpha/beta hydrolase [Gordonia alkanivorans]MDH3047128.1 alpha/beta hydrolase [Gordonia alkanivorans]